MPLAQTPIPILISLPPPILSPPNLPQLLRPRRQVTRCPAHPPLPHRRNQEPKRAPEQQSHNESHPEHYDAPEESEDLHCYYEEQEEDAEGEDRGRVLREGGGPVEIGEEDGRALRTEGRKEAEDGAGVGFCGVERVERM